MTDKILDAVLKRARKAAHRRHSQAYRWLRARHAKLAPVLEQCEPLLHEIADEMNKGGIHGGRNRPVTARAVARIWARVCRDVAEEQQRRQTIGVKPARHQPSRAPATWQPPRAAPMPESRPRAVAPAPSTTDRPSPDPYEGLTEEAKAKLAAVDAQLAWRDRFLHPPPERGQ